MASTPKPIRMHRKGVKPIESGGTEGPPKRTPRTKNPEIREAQKKAKREVRDNLKKINVKKSTKTQMTHLARTNAKYKFKK